jgi:hypothetical protein
MAQQPKDRCDLMLQFKPQGCLLLFSFALEVNPL